MENVEEEEVKVLRVARETLANQDLLDLLVHLDKMDLKVLADLQVILDYLVFLEKMAIEASLAKEGPLVKMDLLVQQDSLA